ncbi:hypothetical protein ACFCXP_16705 [Streptomyces niveus]|uniref:hypothetical protein n=1 Tax=Streptomyces niveus TaxID=193462 RepID=UPI0035D7DBCF
MDERISLGDTKVLTADRLARLLGAPVRQLVQNLKEWLEARQVVRRSERSPAAASSICTSTTTASAVTAPLGAASCACLSKKLPLMREMCCRPIRYRTAAHHFFIQHG